LTNFRKIVIFLSARFSSLTKQHYQNISSSQINSLPPNFLCKRLILVDETQLENQVQLTERDKT